MNSHVGFGAPQRVRIFGSYLGLFDHLLNFLVVRLSLAYWAFLSEVGLLLSVF